MEIHFSREQRRILNALCKDNENEVSGEIIVRREGEKLTIQEIKPDEPEMILQSTPDSVTYDSMKKYWPLAYKLLSDPDSVLVSYHTHPGGYKSLADLSQTDKESLRKSQNMFNRISDGNPIYIECVITNDWLAFFMVDGKQIVRLRAYENGIEVIPPDKLSFFGAMSAVFKEGARKGWEKSRERRKLDERQ